MLKYIGAGGYHAETGFAPARDLSAEESAQFGGVAKLVESGLYLEILPDTAVTGTVASDNLTKEKNDGRETTA